MCVFACAKASSWVVFGITLFPIATRNALLAQSTFVFAPIFGIPVIVWGGQFPGVSVSGWGGVGQEGMVWQGMAGRGRVCRHAIKIAPFKARPILTTQFSLSS